MSQRWSFMPCWWTPWLKFVVVLSDFDNLHIRVPDLAPTLEKTQFVSLFSYSCSPWHDDGLGTEILQLSINLVWTADPFLILVATSPEDRRHKWGLHSMNWSVVFIVYGRLYGLYSWFEGWLWSLGTSYWRPRMVMGLSIPIHVKGETFFTFSSIFPFIMALLDGKTYSTPQPSEYKRRN